MSFGRLTQPLASRGAAAIESSRPIHTCPPHLAKENGHPSRPHQYPPQSQSPIKDYRIPSGSQCLLYRLLTASGNAKRRRQPDHFAGTASSESPSAIITTTCKRFQRFWSITLADLPAGTETVNNPEKPACCVLAALCRRAWCIFVNFRGSQTTVREVVEFLHKRPLFKIYYLAAIHQMWQRLPLHSWLPKHDKPVPRQPPSTRPRGLCRFRPR